MKKSIKVAACGLFVTKKCEYSLFEEINVVSGRMK